MNRHARRAAAAQKKSGSDIGGESGKSKMTLHTDPEDVTPEHLALFLTTAMQAYEFAKKAPGIEFPIHVIVESGDERVCGTMEPDDGLGGNEPFIVDKDVH